VTRRLADTLRAALDGQAVRDDFAAYRDRPVAFALEVLGFSPWGRQADLMRAIASDARVSARSGHKTGKSDGLSLVAVWFCATHPGARVVVTAPTYRQVRSVLWKAIKRFASRLPVGVALAVNDVPDLGIPFANGSEIIGFTADNSEKFAGISGAELLFIIDEASGVEPNIFEAIEGSAAGGARIVMCGNPTRTSGVFYDSFHDRAEFWKTLHISSTETPNAVEGSIVIPGLATRAWVDERRADWGVGSPLYSVRVLGEFPSQGTNNVVPLDLVEAAVRRFDAALFDQDTSRLTLGCDPARFGSDESVIFAVRGPVALAPIVYRGLDSIQLAGRVLEAARRYARPGERPLVRVDSIGIGAGVVDQLKLMADVSVQAINASESASSDYVRCRDELWFGIAEWIKAGGMFPGDSKLQGELVAVEYSFAPNGKRKVESKDDLRNRLGRSPDRADALALAVYQPPNAGNANYLKALEMIGKELGSAGGWGAGVYRR
jgi:phage terminase large subunit